MKRRKRFVKGSRHQSPRSFEKQHNELKNLKKEESRSNRKEKDFLPIETIKEEGTPQGKIRKSLSFIGMAPFSASHVISNRML